MTLSRTATLALAALVSLCAIVPSTARAADPPPKPLEVLLICGGCCHDYTRQKVLIAEGLAERAYIKVTAVQQGGTATNSKIPIYDSPEWSKGYDVVIHDECFSDVKDSKYIANILAPHRAGLGAVVLHCAMHCYRDGTDEWFKFCGVTSRRHGAAYGHEVLNNDPAHPIMQGWGPAWANPAGELYWIEKVWPTAHPLATAKNREKGNDEVCVWTNDYEKARVFGTTLGHHNETVSAKPYLDMLTRGTLWAAGKLEPRYLKTAANDGPKLVPVNLAAGKPGTASSEQGGNFIRQAFDGNVGTRWCANGGNTGEWLQVDLGAPTQIDAAKIDWENTGSYQFRLEGSNDAKTWSLLVDGSKNTKPSPNAITFKPTQARYVRVTFLGNNSNGWGSINEFEIHGDKKELLDPKIIAAQKDASYFQGVKIPDGFDATVFAAPPAINYPVYVAAAPNGDVYVSSDRNGSLDRAKLRGSVYRLRDLDGDGKADEVRRFVSDVDSPRGLVFDRDRIYLMHPPHLSAFIDKNNDGIADEQKILVKNIAFGFKDRPADHTSNGVTMGIDGWLYLAIGDFGFLQAEGTDGRKLQLRGGGVVRVRPDGTGLELYSRGTRNILEASVDPLLNGFARDNTNDGGGWDIRLHHFSGMEDHGYPRLFKNFTDEVIAPLADYGGGSGCGGLYLSEPGFGPENGDALYTADWGRDRIYRHKMTPKGATFSADQTEFLTVPRVTDLDVDAQGHLFVSSWKGATFTFAGEDVGYVLRVTPKGNKPAPLPDYNTLDASSLVSELNSPSHRRRVEAQRTLLAKGVNDAVAAELLALAIDTNRSLNTRVAALFTLKQAKGSTANAQIAALTTDATIREFAIRALTDRLDQLQGVQIESIVKYINDANPRVRLTTAISLARLGNPAGSKPLAALLSDADPVVAHTAIKALVALNGADACFAIVDSTSPGKAARIGALRVLQALHESPVADGLISRLAAEKDTARRLGLIAALARLDHREGFWRGDSWGTRPDTSGPYYQPEAWEASEKIEAALRQALDAAKPTEFAAILEELTRNKVSFAGETESLAKRASDKVLHELIIKHFAKLATVPREIEPVLLESVRSRTDSPATRSNAAIALLKIAGGFDARRALSALAPLEDLPADSNDFRAARDAFLSSDRLASHVADFEKLAANDTPGSTWANAALMTVAQSRARNMNAQRDQANTALAAAWKNPSRQLALLKAVALASDQNSREHVLTALHDKNPAVVAAARDAAMALRLDTANPGARPSGPRVETLSLDRTLEIVSKTKGDRAAGERLFTQLNCVNCHTVKQSDPPKGPFLGTIATTYKRRELAEAILQPSKTIAQGFTTNVFALEDGRTLTGFVTKEAADTVVVRDADGRETTIPTSNIVERAKSNTSVMPEGLVKSLTTGEFASLLDYLESLSKK